jgi:hypothetical protein
MVKTSQLEIDYPNTEMLLNEEAGYNDDLYEGSILSQRRYQSS